MHDAFVGQGCSGKQALHPAVTNESGRSVDGRLRCHDHKGRPLCSGGGAWTFIALRVPWKSADIGSVLKKTDSVFSPSYDQRGRGLG